MGEDGSGQQIAVDDCDRADTFCRRINSIDDDWIVTVIIDVNVRVAVGGNQSTVACRQNLTSKRNLATGGIDVLQNDGSLSGIEITINGHIGHSTGSKCNSRQWSPPGVQ